MSIEIEAKMRLTDRAAVEQRLAEAGAQPHEHVTETNTFFDTGDGSLKSGDQGLRIRVTHRPDEPDEVTITHKGPRAHGKLKSRTENQVGVDDARAAAELLGALGFLPVLSFEKRRRSWLLDGCSVELDELPYLGEYCEIEGPDDETVLAVRAKLGLAEVPLIRASYIAMLQSYMREHNLRTSVIRFPATAPST